MRISGIEVKPRQGYLRLQAEVIWEDSARPSQVIFFEADQESAPALAVNHDAFLTACAVPAMFERERRILVEGDLCPRLRDGVGATMQILGSWFPGEAAQPAIEATGGFKARYPARRPRPGMFLSGGVDSLATLALNRTYYPRDHPASVCDGIIVQGFDIGGLVDQSAGLFDRARKAVGEIATDADLALTSVKTNLLELKKDGRFWAQRWHGSALCAVAHLFSRSLTSAYIAGTYDGRTLSPWGSHPALDPQLSSSALTIIHDALHLSRLEKIKILAGWPTALANVRVCLEDPQSGLNCGSCEKCLRTMLAFQSIGILEDCSAFSTSAITPNDLRFMAIAHDYQAKCYRELLQPLLARKEYDIVEVIRGKILEYETDSTPERQTARELVQVIPSGSTFILVDGSFFDRAYVTPADCHSFPFIEKHGEYWGLPEDDNHAVRETERLCRAGASYLVVAEPAFWCLEHYLGWQKYLCKKPMVWESRYLRVFKLI
jgi:hypothetical protein